MSTPHRREFLHSVSASGLLLPCAAAAEVDEEIVCLQYLYYNYQTSYYYGAYKCPATPIGYTTNTLITGLPKDCDTPADCIKVQVVRKVKDAHVRAHPTDDHHVEKKDDKLYNAYATDANFPGTGLRHTSVLYSEIFKIKVEGVSGNPNRLVKVLLLQGKRPYSDFVFGIGLEMDSSGTGKPYHADRHKAMRVGKHYCTLRHPGPSADAPLFHIRMLEALD